VNNGGHIVWKTSVIFLYFVAYLMKMVVIKHHNLVGQHQFCILISFPVADMKNIESEMGAAHDIRPAIIVCVFTRRTPKAVIKSNYQMYF
jgi:hypothetical protein